MESTQALLRRSAFYLACASAVTVLVSIAACHILLAMAFAALLFSGEKLRLPPIRLPLAVFMAGTLLSLALSPDPAAGRPQIRKFFVFLTLLVVFSLVREVAQMRRLVLVWVGVGTVSAAKSLVQFYEKLDQSRMMGQPFYQHYVAERTTGFMSHWMTFGGQMMILLLLLGAFLMFSPHWRRLLWLWLLAGGTIGMALLLGFTRGIWLASAVAALYLVWHWKRPLVLAAPLLAALFLWLGPASLRERLTSILRPRAEVDSNEHRVITWRTGWRMISAHPFFGLGPEMVNYRFKEFLPPDVRQPLPSGWYGHLHNVYLHYAAERGVPTLLALLWLLGKILWDFLRTLRKLPPGRDDRRFLLQGGVAVMVAMLITGFFELNFGDSEVLTMFLVVVCAGYTAAASVAADARQPEVVHA